MSHARSMCASMRSPRPLIPVIGITVAEPIVPQPPPASQEPPSLASNAPPPRNR